MNTCNTSKPYILTANHCVFQNGNLINTNNSTFEFLWYSPTCNPTTNTSSTVLFNGATIRARWEQSDFALLELNQIIPQNSTLTLLGWSRSSTPPSSSVGIHHPMGDIMKISIENNPASIGSVRTFPNTAWRVLWDQGAVEGGSSGSPLFDMIDHKVVGQLFSNTQPTSPPCNQQSGGTNYGRFDVSWDGGGTNDTRLSNWLDPTGSNMIATNTTDVSVLTAPSLILSITGGNNSICTNGSSATYILNGAPTGTNVIWSLSNPYIASVSSNGNQATVTMNSNGSTTLTATVGNSNCFSNNVAYKAIRLGSYTTSEYNITQWPTPACLNGNVQVGMPWYYTPPAPNTSYNWYWSSNLTYVSGQSTSVVTLRVTSSYPTPWVMGRANNDCGIGPFQTISLNINPYCYAYSAYAVSPNPASDVLRIEPNINQETGMQRTYPTDIIEVEMINKMGISKLKKQFGKGINTTTLNVNTLPNDVYTLRIFDGKNWYSHKIIIQH